ncbi:MAG: hypothetical protein ACR2KG_08155 [Nocardioidaceae bacterium]
MNDVVTSVISLLTVIGAIASLYALLALKASLSDHARAAGTPFRGRRVCTAGDSTGMNPSEPNPQQ